VERIQLALSRAGFLPKGEIDGIFGPVTKAALMRFQTANSLKPDGLAGPLTQRALRPWLVGYVTVTVKPGDTMYRIAKKYSADLAQVLAANPALDPRNIPIGYKLTVPLRFDVVPDCISFTSTLLGYCIEGLKARYPFIRIASAGKSVMGRELNYIVVGDDPNKLFLNAAHHANEWITSLFAIKFLEEFLKAISSGNAFFGYDAAALYSSVSFICLPMVNPDGADLVTGEIAPGSDIYENALAMNYPGLPFPEGWKANIEGIDLNLQYPAGWETARRIKFEQGYTRPGPRDYVGAAPLVAPESEAVYSMTKASDFALTLSYHTSGEVIYWKYDGFEPPGSLSIGEELSKVSGYPLELTPEASGYAGYKDWFIQEFDRPGYTVEAGSGTSPVSLDQFSRIYSANAPLVLRALEIVSYK
jgi:g-D-glutamyl-meso-diaminopimelate peptidase